MADLVLSADSVRNDASRYLHINVGPNLESGMSVRSLSLAESSGSRRISCNPISGFDSQHFPWRHFPDARMSVWISNSSRANSVSSFPTF